MERCWHSRPRTAAVHVAVLAFLCLTLTGFVPISAQGITTSAIQGTVRAENRASVDGALVRVVNLSTGYATETRVRGGSFLVQGLATGGPYRIVVRSLGYAPEVLDGLSLALGERREVDFTLVSLANQLDTVRVTANNDRAQLPSAGGVGTLISDSSLRRLPTLNRDMYDFVRLVPQAGTRLGLTGGGANFRFNSYVIDGVSDRQLQGNNVLGPGTIGGKTISLEAVKEYQVLLSPYEARYGDFAGMLVNAVTKSGTNELHGSAYGYLRNAQLARPTSFVGNSPYRHEQFGFSLGGPIVRDRMHFFIAPEFEHATAPTRGPYVGQAVGASPALPVSVDDVTRFGSLLRAQGLEPGDGGRVLLLNPSVTLFGRLDIALPEWKSRVVLHDNYSNVDFTRFTRPEGVPVFPLSSNAWTLRTAKHTTAVQIFTQASTAVFNEFLLAYMNRPIDGRDYSLSPSILAIVATPSGVASANLLAGPPAAAGGAAAAEALMEIADHLVFQPRSRHTLGAGVHVELFRYHAQSVRGKFGVWRFSSLDSLANGDASNYSFTKDFGSARARVHGVKPSAYFTDEWRIGDRLSLTLGLRADALKFFSLPAYNPTVDSVFQRRTSDYPRSRAQWSPRFGFSWEPFEGLRTRVRGGAGIFVGPPPLGWLLGPVRSNGSGVRTLTCTGPIGSGRVPKFIPEPALQPQVCPGGRGFSDGPVALVDRNLRMAESFRTSLAIDRLLPLGVTATVEALYSKVRSDFLFVNANLQGPQGVDSHGRVLYGTIDPSGRTRPALVDTRGPDGFPEVIDLRNHSLGYSWSVTAQIDRPFSDRYELRAAYTRSRVRDVQSLANMAAAAPFDNWAGGRPLSGRHEDLSIGVSAFEIPHRVVLGASYVAPWKRWKTDISLYYVGESGTPFTFGDSTPMLMGDLNADGTSANDPIYVPRNANDPSEVVFAGSDAATQAAAFEKFIRDTPCLRRQRGTIVARNSCRSPWVNTSNASIRQSLQAARGHDVSLQLEVFNLLNLLNSSWGLLRLPNEKILQHAGQTTGTAAQPVFRFDAANAGTSTQNLESGYQLQLSLRYSF
jgi:TonB-dependent receptor-like protein/carboxypeptidase family protein